MTFEESAQRVGEQLCELYNQQNLPAVDGLFATVDEALARHVHNQVSRRTFWVEVEKGFYAAGPLFIKQANSSLHALMKLIEARLSDRQSVR